MKQLLIIAAVLAAVFASTFLLIKGTGLVTLADIEGALAKASRLDSIYVVGIIVVLLFSDLFIAIPTLTVSILAGYFLGFALGGVSSLVGMLASGVTGYFICWKYGPSLLLRIYKDPKPLQEMQSLFAEHGTIALILCRAAPILPEVCCCLAGANRMPVQRFLVFYIIGTAPYAFIAAYAGSQSSLADPKPAAMAFIGVSSVLWLAWSIFIRRNYGKGTAEVEL